MAARYAVMIAALLTAVLPVIAQAGRVRITVVDVTKAPLARVEVAIIGADDKPIRTQISDERGVSRWTGLPMGDVRFRATVPYFKTKLATVRIKNSNELPVEVVLDIAETQPQPSIIDRFPLLPVEGR